VAERFTNNSENYRNELIQKLENKPDVAEHSFLFFFSAVDSFLLHVNSFFIYRSKRSDTLLAIKRSLDQTTIISNYGIYFPDKIRFTEFVFEMDKQTSSDIVFLLEKDLGAPNPQKHIILDGATFHLKIETGNNGSDFTWVHEEQLNDSTRELVNQFEKLMS
jgi:hypothetical protein